MSSYILCQTKKAENPYYVENISTNIYTIEELCYYLYQNLYLLDQTIFNEELCSWLAEELDLTKLAGKIRPLMGKFTSAEDILYPIFKEINYLTYEELKDLNARLSRMDEEAPAIREKKKGDALMRNKMYVHAIRVYQKLLKREDLEEIREGFTAEVYHNLGCAYSYLFQMERALACFEKAYEHSNSLVDLKCYLLAFHGLHTKEEYEELLGEVQADEEMKAAVQDTLARLEKKELPEVPQDKMDAMLSRLTADYHRSTGS
jgi:tetratricopeptide (TPR) repeat protein